MFQLDRKHSLLMESTILTALEEVVRRAHVLERRTRERLSGARPPARLPLRPLPQRDDGDKLLDPGSFPADVHPLSISQVGRYAIHIQWSDGHSTGIYTFQRLRELDQS